MDLLLFNLQMRQRKIVEKEAKFIKIKKFIVRQIIINLLYGLLYLKLPQSAYSICSKTRGKILRKLTNAELRAYGIIFKDEQRVRPRIRSSASN